MQDSSFGLRTLQPCGCFGYLNGSRCLTCDKWLQLKPWIVAYCRFGTRWRKRTKLFSFQQHYPRRYEDVVQWLQEASTSRTYIKEAQDVMDLSCSSLPCRSSRCGCRPMDWQWLPSCLQRTAVLIPACARAGTLWIGEARSPGPRRRRGGVRSGALSISLLLKLGLLKFKIKFKFGGHF